MILIETQRSGQELVAARASKHLGLDTSGYRRVMAAVCSLALVAALPTTKPVAAQNQALALGVKAVAANAIAAGPAVRSIYFYASAGAANGKSGRWGNGSFKVAKDVDYEGAEVLEVVTRNMNEGVRFDLDPPVEIGPYMATGYVRLRARFGGGAPAMGGFPGGGYPGGSSGYPGGYPGSGGGFSREGGFGAPLVSPRLDASQPEYRSSAQLSSDGNSSGEGGGRRRRGRGGSGGYPGGRPPGGFGEGPPPGDFGGFPGGEGGFPAVPMGPPPQKTAITRLQVTLMLDRGILSGGMDVDLEKTTSDDGGWRLFALPLRDMRSTPGASGSVRRLIVTSDKEDSWYLAQAALVVDTGQMTVSIRQPTDPPGAQVAEITVKPGPVSLVADVEAGATDTAIEWNFDADNVGNLPVTTLPTPGFPPAPGFPGAPGDSSGRGDPGLSSSSSSSSGRPPFSGIPGGEGAVIEAPVGPRIDARGLVAKFEYPNEEQNYRVEVTVRDRAGKKQPVTSSILVKVRG